MIKLAHSLFCIPDESSCLAASSLDHQVRPASIHYQPTIIALPDLASERRAPDSGDFVVPDGRRHVLIITPRINESGLILVVFQREPPSAL
jgi:hypothetical protein